MNEPQPPSGLRITPFPRAQQAVSPWKNGGGSTRVVAIDPPGADANSFRWRVSIAEVASDGPFSLFPGIDRSLWLLRGEGMLLTLPDRQVRLAVPLLRFDFAGETPIQAQLLDGPTQDLNVMVDRARVMVDARVSELRRGTSRPLVLKANVECLVLALVGSVTVAIDTTTTALGEGDALRRDGGGNVTLAASDRSATILVAQFAAQTAG